MKAITLNEAGAPPAARDDLPTPTPGLARRCSCACRRPRSTPSTAPSPPACSANMGVEHEYPVTLGGDYAGVVEQVGADVTGYAPGDEVSGFLLHANPTARHGSWTNMTVSNRHVHRPPAHAVAPAAAGARPGGHHRGDRHRGPRPRRRRHRAHRRRHGGVGSFAVQLAAEAGATVDRTRAARGPGLPARPRRHRSSPRARPTSPPPSASASPTASTRCSTSSTTRPAPTTPRSRRAPASPRRPAPPAKAPAAPWSSPQPTTENLDRVAQLLYSGALKSPLKPPTSSTAPPSVSGPRRPATRRASSPSASPNAPTCPAGREMPLGDARRVLGAAAIGARRSSATTPARRAAAAAAGSTIRPRRRRERGTSRSSD